MMASTLERSWTKWTTLQVRQFAELLHDTWKSHDNSSTQQFANLIQAQAPSVHPFFEAQKNPISFSLG